MFVHKAYLPLIAAPANFLFCEFSKMASKRKFVGENSQALVPVKKPKQHQVALSNQGGAIQAVCVNFCSVHCLF